MYAIFINDSVIYLSEKPHENVDVSSLKYDNHNFDELVESLFEKEATKLCFFHHNNNELWQIFQNQFKIIEAAGGLVFNEEKEVLWILRHNVWDLPKGKIEKGESREVAAIREVQEECGLKNVALEEFLITTYHMYKHKGKKVLKFSHWYKMLANSKEKLVPQTEEEITKVEWFSDIKLSKIFENTYSNIKLIRKFAFDKKRDFN